MLYRYDGEASTWRLQVSAVRCAAGFPSLPSPLQIRASFPPALCAGLPGSSSSAHDVSEATGRQRTGGSLSTSAATVPLHMSYRRGLTSASESFSFCTFSLTFISNTCSISISIFFILFTCSRLSSSIWAKGLLHTHTFAPALHHIPPSFYRSNTAGGRIRGSRFQKGDREVNRNQPARSKMKGAGEAEVLG